ncbi:MAG TPA: hypothetical protein VN626_04290, partial [Clostridia bacterium]|nr:hypothetical protein [Clostridia bacterium]
MSVVVNQKISQGPTPRWLTNTYGTNIKTASSTDIVGVMRFFIRVPNHHPKFRQSLLIQLEDSLYI